MTISELSKDEKETPFSNGTGAMIWYGQNCENCKRAYFPKNGEWPKEKTLEGYVSCGKYCILQYFIDYGFVTSEVPKTVIDVIGRDKNGYISEQCRMFSDDDNDRYKHPKKPRPDAPNQMVMPFLLNELLEVNPKVKEVV